MVAVLLNRDVKKIKVCVCLSSLRKEWLSGLKRWFAKSKYNSLYRRFESYLFRFVVYFWSDRAVVSSLGSYPKGHRFESYSGF